MLFSFLTWRYFPSLALLAHLVVVSSLVAIAFIDLEHMLIPDVLVLLVGLSGLALDVGLCLAGEGQMLPLPLYKLGLPLEAKVPRSVAGAVLGLLLFFAIAKLGGLAFRKEAMGEGDVLLAGALGAYLGPGWKFLLFFLLAAIIGAAVGVAFALVRKKGLSTAVPFGPMMAASAIIVALLGDRLTALITGAA